MVKQLNIRIIELHKASPWPTEEYSVIGKTDIKQIAAKKLHDYQCAEYLQDTMGILNGECAELPG